jgi:catechol 2,3-dioxygenase-like lactoylglutathione lyase family enzyme
MLGRFLEVSIATDDIIASVQFYERLGFTQLTANDTWAHPYGVLSDGRLCIGLHQRPAHPAILSFVYPELAAHARQLRAAGFAEQSAQLGEGQFHQLQLRDPADQSITLLEARTFSPARNRQQESLCGWFSAFSMPALGNDGVREFWERVGFVALAAQDTPFAHLPLTGDHLSLALHAPRTMAEPMLVFVDPGMPAKLAALENAGIARSSRLPRGLDAREHALVEAPEGTLLLLLNADP